MSRFDTIKDKFRSSQYDYDKWLSLSRDSRKDIKKNNPNSYREYKNAVILRNKYGDNFTYGNYKLYLASQRYNTALFFRLLFKIFAIFAPFIIISIIMQSDDFKFDFFVFVKRFENLQFSLSGDLMTFIKNLGSWRYNNLEFVDAQNILDVLRNIGILIGNVGVLLFELISCLGFIVTFIVDFFANVFAFVGALIPSLVL